MQWRNISGDEETSSAKLRLEDEPVRIKRTIKLSGKPFMALSANLTVRFSRFFTAKVLTQPPSDGFK